LKVLSTALVLISGWAAIGYTDAPIDNTLFQASLLFSHRRKTMKRMLIIMVIAIAASSIAFSQTKMSKDSKVEAQIIALEKQAWQEWSNKNTSFVQNYLADDAFYVYADGVVDKTEIVKSIPTCDLKSFSLDNFTFRMLDKNSALLNYTASQDATCYGKKQAANIRVNSVYVKRGGKWLSLSYMETSATQ